MTIIELRGLSYDEIRSLYKDYLTRQDFAHTTIQTSYSDTFYLWRMGSKEIFWNIVTSSNFEKEAESLLMEALSSHSSGNASKLISGYLSHLRKFLKFVETMTSSEAGIPCFIPTPSAGQIKFYLKKWDVLESYYMQENH